MILKSQKILLVDDEELNLDILNEYLQEAGFTTILAKNGLEATAQLGIHNDISAIILDRMMPVMDGMEFLKSIKSLENYRAIPVVMQTAAGTVEQMMDGIGAGVFYYLTKPYEKQTLLTVLNSALEQSNPQAVMRNIKSRKINVPGLKNGVFNFRTMKEAKDLTYAIAEVMPDPAKIIYGLREMTTNAIEHGNLGISLAEKESLMEAGSWGEEVARRLELPENAEKYATLTFTSYDDHYELRIKDMGNGFNPEPYLQFDASRMNKPVGRGIIMAKIYSFDDMKYIGNGNEVVCTVKRV